MASSSDSYHEDIAALQPETVDRHRAIVSLQEECEAVDWYDQRIDATTDAELGAILAHNRDEEKEHAAMTLEWIRRNDPTWDEQLRTYLFTDRPIVQAEDDADDAEADDAAVAEGDGGTSSAGAGDLGIRTLRGSTSL